MKKGLAGGGAARKCQRYRMGIYQCLVGAARQYKWNVRVIGRCRTGKMTLTDNFYDQDKPPDGKGGSMG